MRVTLADVAAFGAELAVYVAVAVVAWNLLPRGAMAAAGSLLAIVLMASWWGALHAPRAPLHAPGILDPVLRIAWFCTGVLAAIATVALRHTTR